MRTIEEWKAPIVTLRQAAVARSVFSEIPGRKIGFARSRDWPVFCELRVWDSADVYDNRLGDQPIGGLELGSLGSSIATFCSPDPILIPSTTFRILGDVVKMRTKVVHNRLHFSYPKVIVVDSETFYLVFTKDVETGKWNFDVKNFRVDTDFSMPAAPDTPSAFAVRATVLENSPQWKLALVHEEAGPPLKAVRLNGESWRQGVLACNPTWMKKEYSYDIFEKSGDKTGLAFDNCGSVVSAGDCVELIMEFECKHGFRFSLFEDEENDEPAETEEMASRSESKSTRDLRVPLPKPSLLKLPEDILHEIVSLVGVKEIQQSVPLVCQELHEIAKKRVCWPVLKISTKLRSDYEDFIFLCTNAREHCVSLTLEHSKIGETLADFRENSLLKCVFTQKWKKLKKLRLVGRVNEDLDVGLKYAIENGCFPALEELSLCTDALRKAVKCLCAGSFPDLKALVVRSAGFRMEYMKREHGCNYGEPSSPYETEDEEFDSAGFLTRLPGLERLAVIDEGGGLMDALLFFAFIRGFQMGSLPRLKELRLALSRNVDLAMIGTFSLPGLEAVYVDLAPMGRRSEFTAGRMLDWFPNVKTLSVRSSEHFPWDGVDPGRLALFERVSVPASPDVPLRAMKKLKVLTIVMTKDDPGPPNFADINQLPDLVALKVTGRGFMEKLLGQLTGPLPNLQFLVLEDGDGFGLNAATWPHLQRLLDVLPGLKRLSLRVWSLALPDRLLRDLAGKVAGLTSLKLERRRDLTAWTGFEDAAKSWEPVLGPNFQSYVKEDRAFFWKHGTVEPSRQETPLLEDSLVEEKTGHPLIFKCPELEDYL